MLEHKVKQLLSEQHKLVKDLCQYIDMTDTALRKMYARDSCEITTLKKIATFFGVSPCYFFDDSDKAGVSVGDDSIAVGGNATNINSYKAIQEMIAEVSAQRKMTEKAMEQIDRLVGIIDSMTKHN